MNRKRRLELGGAVLMAAAAVLFAACEMDPVKRADSNDAGGAETVKEAAPADQAAGVQQDSQTSEKAAEPSPRLERLLNTLYRVSGSESNPKIRDWLVWRGTKMIADGKNDEDICFKDYNACLNPCLVLIDSNYAKHKECVRTCDRIFSSCE